MLFHFAVCYENRMLCHVLMILNWLFINSTIYESENSYWLCMLSYVYLYIYIYDYIYAFKWAGGERIYLHFEWKFAVLDEWEETDPNSN